MNNTEELQSILQPHQTITVVGANWGDEGKGKVIDLVMGHYDVVARFSGGANAGHTVFTNDNKKLVSHLIPCGLAQNKMCVMSRGEFFNVELFLQELADSKAILNGELPPIYVDHQAALWTPYHRLFEMYIEARRGENKVGTTNKGIGPLEGIYKLRLAPVVGMLFEPELLLTTLQSLYSILEPCFASQEFMGIVTETIPTPQVVAQQLLEQAGAIKEYVTDTAFFLHKQLQEHKRILFEGAQATGLDAWWGTYPYVSSGNSVAAGAALGTGLPLQKFDATILVAKTLPTRVGFGPFVAEMWDRQKAMDFARDNGNLFKDPAARKEFLQNMLTRINSGEASNAELSQYFQVLGDERGATTGRGRSVGFLDIPWLQYAVRINGPQWLALTRFDMLSGVKSLPVVKSYSYKGTELAPGAMLPSWQQKDIKPIFEQWECWEENIYGMNTEEQLPQSAQLFLDRLEQSVNVPILLVGTGPGRGAMVVRARQNVKK